MAPFLEIAMKRGIFLSDAPTSSALLYRYRSTDQAREPLVRQESTEG
jgi:hypothetical protein